MNDFTIIIDTREQTPFAFKPDIPTVSGSLETGDYSIQGMQDLITVERKSLSDIVGCCGKGRDRFKRELHRMRGFKAKCVIIEATLQRVSNGNWRSQIKPASVLGSIASWRHRYGIDFIYAGNPELGAEECVRYLRAFYNYCKEFSMRFQ